MFTQSINTKQTEQKFIITQKEGSIYYQLSGSKELKAIEVSDDLYKVEFYFADVIKSELEETGEFTEEEKRIRGIVSSAVYPPLPEIGCVSSNSKYIQISGMESYTSMAKLNAAHIAETLSISEQLHPLEWILTKARNSGILPNELYDRIRIDVRHRTLQMQEITNVNQSTYHEVFDVFKDKYSPNANFKRITTSADTYEFAGQIVAYLSDCYYFSDGSNAITLPVNVLGQQIRFARLNKYISDWQGGEKGYDMDVFLKPEGVGSAHALVDSLISEDSVLAMRLATVEELEFLKLTLELDQGRLNYREKEKDTKMIVDEIAKKHSAASLPTGENLHLQGSSQFSLLASKQSATTPPFTSFAEGMIDWLCASEPKDKSGTPKPSKVYLIKGGNEKSRHDKAYELARQDSFAMYGVYPNKDKSEFAVVFSCDHDTFNLMNFDLAKKLAGEKQLPAEFSASIIGRGDRFGVVNLGNTLTTKIDITGLNKADVLLALYNNATCEGVAFDYNPIIRVLIAMNPSATADAVEKEIKLRFQRDNLDFDYVDLGAGPRPLKVNLSGFEFDSTTYDEYHGKGAANAIITDLRLKCTREYQQHAYNNSFFALLAKIKIGSAITQQNDVVVQEDTDLVDNNEKQNNFKSSM